MFRYDEIDYLMPIWLRKLWAKITWQLLNTEFKRKMAQLLPFSVMERSISIVHSVNSVTKLWSLIQLIQRLLKILLRCNKLSLKNSTKNKHKKLKEKISKKCLFFYLFNILLFTWKSSRNFGTTIAPNSINVRCIEIPWPNLVIEGQQHRTARSNAELEIVISCYYFISLCLEWKSPVPCESIIRVVKVSIYYIDSQKLLEFVLNLRNSPSFNFIGYKSR